MTDADNAPVLTREELNFIVNVMEEDVIDEDGNWDLATRQMARRIVGKIRRGGR